MDSLNVFEKIVMDTIDATLKKQNCKGIEKCYLEDGLKPVKLTQEILKSKDYPKSYKYIIGNRNFILQFYDKTENGDSDLKAVAVFSNSGFNLQFDTRYVYSGTHTNLSNEIIKDVEKANGNIGIIQKILQYML